MRVAAQEGIGGTPHEAVGTRSSGGAASAGGAFLALLALLQGGGATGDVATTPGAADAADLADGEKSDAGDEPAPDAAANGVVVTLSVAANAAGSASANAAAAQATTATTQEGTSDALTLDAAPGGRNAAVAKGLTGVAAAIADATTDPAPGASIAANGGAAAAAPAAAGDATALAAEGAAAAAKPAKDGVALARTAQAAAADPAKAEAAFAARAHHAQGADGKPSRDADGATKSATPPTPAAPAAPTAAQTADASGAAAEQGAVGEAVRGVARRATDGARREPRIADGETDDAGDDVAADGAFGASRGTTGSGATRELPAGVRVVSEPLPLQSSQAHGAAHTAGDPTSRADALGAMRSDATAASSSSNGTTRLRASGFSSGEAGLPSWVERLASPEGLAATRRGNTLQIDLEPNGLGRIELRLTFGRDGVRASVLTEHEHTRTLLASQQPQLAAALERNDVRLESFLVDVGAQSGGDGREAWRDATDPAAFDQIGLVHTSTSDPVVDEPAAPMRGLVNVRA